jgi:hypothetical protein
MQKTKKAIINFMKWRAKCLCYTAKLPTATYFNDTDEQNVMDLSVNDITTVVQYFEGVYEFGGTKPTWFTLGNTCLFCKLSGPMCKGCKYAKNHGLCHEGDFNTLMEFYIEGNRKRTISALGYIEPLVRILIAYHREFETYKKSPTNGK